MLEVLPLDYIAVSSTIQEFIVLWCDAELNKTCFGCREKIGDQLRWSLEHAGIGDNTFEYDCIPITTSLDARILRVMVLRAMRLSEADLNENEVLYIISIPYINELHERKLLAIEECRKLFVVIHYNHQKRRRRNRRRRDKWVEYTISVDGFYV